MQFYSRINCYPLKFPKAAKVKHSLCPSASVRNFGKYWDLLHSRLLDVKRKRSPFFICSIMSIWLTLILQSPFPCSQQTVEKALYLDINWCLHCGPWLSISSPVIAGMHGWRAGIRTVNEVINDNPHDRRGPLKLPARQKAMVLLAFSL